MNFNSEQEAKDFVKKGNILYLFDGTDHMFVHTPFDPLEETEIWFRSINSGGKYISEPLENFLNYNYTEELKVLTRDQFITLWKSLKFLHELVS